MKQKKKHNYPKTRKQRDTSYSATYQLLDMFGEAELYRIWSIGGMRRASKILREEHDVIVNPEVIRYLSYKFNWKREVTDANLPFVRGVLLGSVPANKYKHVIIPDRLLKEYGVESEDSHIR